MKRILFALCVVCLAATLPPATQPAAPALLQLQRGPTGVSVTWHYEGDFDAFQVMRRSAFESKAIVVGLHKCQVQQVAGRERRFTWEDKRAQPTTCYTYSVQVFNDGELSAESGVLTIGP